MPNKSYYTHDNIKGLTQTILHQLARDNWRPDYVVGLTRGGLLPAVYISQYLDIPMHTLEVKLRDHANTESNLWMAEDAFGYKQEPKNILIVDDINDTGATLDWIIEDWQRSCLPNDPKWTNIWGHNVRFAVLIDNLSSKFSRTVDYHGEEINKAERDVWIVFPYEEWWKSDRQTTANDASIRDAYEQSDYDYRSIDER